MENGVSLPTDEEIRLSLSVVRQFSGAFSVHGAGLQPQGFSTQVKVRPLSPLAARREVLGRAPGPLWRRSDKEIRQMESVG